MGSLGSLRKAGGTPPAHSLIADRAPPERRASAMSVYSLGVLLGGGLGMALGGYIASAYGWRVAIMAVSLPGVALAAIVRLFAIEPRRGISDASAAMAADDGAIGLGAGFAQLWRTAAARHLVAAITVTSIVGYAASSWIPSYLQRSFGMSLTEVATYMALPASVIAATSALLGGWLCDRAAKRSGVGAQGRVVAVLQLASLPFLLAFYALGDRASSLGCYFVAVLFGGSYIGPTYAMIQHLAPARLRATWAAITLLSVNLVGLGAGPFLTGQLSDVLRRSFGEDALRWSLFAIALLTPWAVFHYWRAGRLMQARRATPDRAETERVGA